MPDAAQPSLTLAIPFYSQVDYLSKAVSSVAAQRYTGCTLLVCDDSPAGLSASDQLTIERLVASRFPLRIVRTRGAQGMASTWNRCLDEAQTDLVTLVHGDDELEPDYAAHIVALAERHPEATAVFCGTSIIDEQGQDLFSFADWYKQLLIPPHGSELVLRGDSALHSLLRGNYIFCPTLCYRRSSLDGIRFDTAFRMVLDFDLVARILLSGGTLVGVPHRSLYRYRRHANNATAQLTRELTRFREESWLYSHLAERCTELGFVRAATTARAQRIIKLNLGYCTLRDLSQKRFADAFAKLKMLGQVQTGTVRNTTSPTP